MAKRRAKIGIVRQRFGLGAWALAAACAHAQPLPPAAAPTLVSEQWTVAAQAYHQSGSVADAVAAASQATAINPRNQRAWLLIARGEMALGHTEKALVAYEQARRQGCRDPMLFAELASTYDITKRYREAIAVYRDYLRDHPSDVDMQDELAMTLLLAGKPSAAVDELQNALSRAPQAAHLQLDLGYAYLRCHQYDKARDILVLYTAMPHAEARASHYLARSYAGLGAYDDAVATLTAQLAAHPQDRVAPVLLRHIYQAQKAAPPP